MFFKNDVLDQSPLDLLWLDHRVWPFMWRCREIPIRAAGLCWHADLCRNPAVTRARGKRRSLTLQHAGGEGDEKPHIYIEWYRSSLRVVVFFFSGVPWFWIRSKAQSDWLLDDLSKEKKVQCAASDHPSIHPFMISSAGSALRDLSFKIIPLERLRVWYFYGLPLIDFMIAICQHTCNIFFFLSFKKRGAHSL